MLSTGPLNFAYFLAVGELTQPWWDYPGLELWKFLNLFVFVAALIYFLKRPLTEAFRARREAIRKELLMAAEEKDQALSKLAEVEALLGGLDSEIDGIRRQATSEAAAERERIARETELEVLKLREQARREILSAGKVVKHSLRLFAAHESVKLAEEVIRREIRPDDDVKLVHLSVEQVGRA